MGATDFLMKETPPRVATEMALHVLAYNLTRVMNIIGVRPLLMAIRAQSPPTTPWPWAPAPSPKHFYTTKTRCGHPH